MGRGATPEGASQQQAVEPDPPPPPDEVVAESESARLLYNCLAWSLGFTDVWIQPAYQGRDKKGGYVETRNRKKDGSGDNTYLPLGEAGLDTLPTYSMVTTAKAYGAKEEVKVDGTKIKASLTSAIPAEYYKIVVFEGKDSKYTHVMRQDADGTWSSKNGGGERVIGIKDPDAYYKANYNPTDDVKPVYLFRKTEKLGKR